MKLDDVCAVVTAVLLYINAEGGLLNGEKQMVTNKNSRGANHSLLKLPAFARPLCEEKLCQLTTGMCRRCLGTKDSVTSQCCLKCQC